MSLTILAPILIKMIKINKIIFNFNLQIETDFNLNKIIIKNSKANLYQINK